MIKTLKKIPSFFAKRRAAAGKVLQVALMVCTGLALSAALAHATLTADQQAVVDGVNTMISDMTTVAWAMVLSVTGTIVGMKIFKLFIRKAT